MSSVQANTTYSLTNAKGGTCVDVSGGDNTSVIGFQFHKGPNQTWTFESAGDQTWNVKSGSGQYLAVESGDIHDGQKAIAAGSPFTWRVEDAQGGVRLSPANNNNYSLDLSDHGSSTPGTPIQLWSRWGGENQIWKVQQV